MAGPYYAAAVGCAGEPGKKAQIALLASKLATARAWDLKNLSPISGSNKSETLGGGFSRLWWFPGIAEPLNDEKGGRMLRCP